METMESSSSASSTSVPPGFRFHPTDEELVGYYLRKKVASHKIDLDVIRDIDLYRVEPWDFQEKCGIGYEEQNEWYFFSHKDKKYPTGTRTNRATMVGFWKATGRDKAVYDMSKLIGMRKTLVFYKGRAPNGQKTDWIMHEYRLESDENGSPQEEGWVVCRAFKKRSSGKTKLSILNERSWGSSYFDHSSHPQKLLVQNKLFYKEPDHNLLRNLIQNETTFVQLPQLESPSQHLLLINSSSLETIRNVNKEEEKELQANFTKKVTDWRDLDKFVASQLSQDHNREALSSYDHGGDLTCW